MYKMADSQEKWYHFFLCPNCLRITKSWIEYAEEYVSVEYEVIVDGYSTERISSDLISDHFVGSECPICGAKFDYGAGIFEIKISRKLEIKPVGSYYDDYDVWKTERNKIIDQFLKWREKHARE